MAVQWVTAFIDRPQSTVDSAVHFWSRVTATSLSPARGERGEFATFLPLTGDAFLRVQTVADGVGSGHLDLHVADIGSVAERAVALGARAEPRDGYITVVSPAGLRWCLVPAGDAEPRRPDAVTREAGHSSLVDQVCIDIPPGAYDTERAFWGVVTGWDVRRGSRPEFAVLDRPAGIPLRLLLQRLDTVPEGGRATCHLDLACTDVDAEVDLHERWGAQVVARFPNWTTLTDPTGVPYCVTRRDPVIGTLGSA